MDRLVDEMANEIQDLLRVKMAQSGPWFLTADGATSKGRSLYTFDIVNANDEYYHLALLDGGAQRLDSAWLKEQLRSMAERVPNLCGVSQDTARTCKKAFRDLHQDLVRGDPGRWSRLAYVDCGEHVSQLLAGDLAGAIPWMKDSLQLLFSDSQMLFAVDLKCVGLLGGIVTNVAYHQNLFWDRVWD